MGQKGRPRKVTNIEEKVDKNDSEKTKGESEIINQMVIVMKFSKVLL